MKLITRLTGRNIVKMNLCVAKKYGQVIRQWKNCLFLFLTVEAWSHGGLRARELGQTPLVLVWLTNVSTSPNLYIEFSTEY